MRAAQRVDDLAAPRGGGFELTEEEIARLREKNKGPAHVAGP